MKSPAAQQPNPAGPAPWDWHRRALLALRETLVAEQELRHAAFRAPREEVAGDFGDAAGTQQERDELVAELSLEKVELTEIDAALARIQNGRYGICEATGERIAPERLRAVPWTRFTQAAAARIEAARRPPGA